MVEIVAKIGLQHICCMLIFFSIAAHHLNIQVFKFSVVITLAVVPFVFLILPVYLQIISTNIWIPLKVKIKIRRLNSHRNPCNKALFSTCVLTRKEYVNEPLGNVMKWDFPEKLLIVPVECSQNKPIVRSLGSYRITDFFLFCPFHLWTDCT